MEEGLIIGYDMCKDYCRISYYEEGQDEPSSLSFTEKNDPFIVQNSICKKKNSDQWLIGQEGYETALLGDGTIVDKLLRLVSVVGVATIEKTTYQANELLYHFIDETLKVLFKQQKTKKIARIVFTIQELDTKVMDAILYSMKQLNVERSKVHFMSHTESYLYFVLSQPRDLWSNLAVLYDLSESGLNYYELQVRRGIQPNIAVAKRQYLEDHFAPGILEKKSGQRMADTIMTSCVERMLGQKLISSGFLSGKGMEDCQKWGPKFITAFCTRRKVFYIENIFAKGAVYAACDHFREKSAYPFRILCEGRVNVNISIEVHQGISVADMELAKVGMNWYEIKKEFTIIPDHTDVLKIKIQSVDDRRGNTVTIPLTDFPKRGNKLTKIGVTFFFTSDNQFTVLLRDQGFGELFPPSGIEVKHEFVVE